MKRMKTFFKYFIIFLAVYFLVSFLSAQTMKSTYKDKKVNIEVSQGNVEIIESKATITNGYIKGKYTNNTDQDIKDKVLKLDFLNKKGKSVGTKYVNIKDLAKGETMDFVSRFNFDNVDHIVASVVEKAKLGDLKLLDFSLDDIKFDRFPWYVWLAGAIIIFG